MVCGGTSVEVCWKTCSTLCCSLLSVTPWLCNSERESRTSFLPSWRCWIWRVAMICLRLGLCCKPEASIYARPLLQTFEVILWSVRFPGCLYSISWPEQISSSFLESLELNSELLNQVEQRSWASFNLCRSASWAARLCFVPRVLAFLPHTL